ncbi:MAG: hypothetical protein VR72_10650 [Clostridiaceae bacterium BRH_c20a]|nr:MAG: hypothetical protein VR72_10650 [Clostridiaceae bacterium BRH_c20a]
MRFFLYYFIFRIFLGSPLLALFIIFFLYLIIDRQFIGLFPDFLKPFKRSSRIKALKELVKLNPANVDGYKELGQLYLEGKKYTQAVEYFEKCLEKMAEYADIHFYLGKGLYLMGQKEEGCKEITKALSISPKIAYGEPYIYLLEYQLDNNPIPEKVNEFLKKIWQFGTPEILYKCGSILLKYDSIKGRELLQEAVSNYKAMPGNFRKLHRRWAFLARLKLFSR